MKRFLLLLLASLISLFSISEVKAQLAGSSVFLQGQFVEIGISECGVHGSAEDPPTGPFGEYHGFNINGLGFIADHEKDGWDSATVAGQPVFCGDYFTPGSPEEGWAIQYGDSIYENHYVGCSGYGYGYVEVTSGTSDIPGSIITYSDTLGVKTGVWGGLLETDDLDLTITQSTILPDTALFFILQVEITNNSTTDLSGLYYTYNVDPDQDVDGCGSFWTINQVISNFPDDSIAQVTAVGDMCECFFSLSSSDERARVSYGNFFLSPGTPEGVWNGDTSQGYYNEGIFECDCAVQISFKLDIAAGATETIYYARAFAPAAVEQALTYIEEISELPFEVLADGVNATDGASQICAGESIELSVESDDEYTWTWEPSTYLSAATGASVTSTPDETITYTITGTPVSGTPVSSTITINVIPEIELLMTSSASLADEPTGSASAIIVSGGLAPYTYLWSDGSTTETLVNILPGDYTVIVTDAAGCNATATVTVDVSQSMYDLQNSNAFSIYPNPVSDGFTFSSEIITGAVTLQFMNANGQIVSEMYLEDAEEKYIDTKAISAGAYVLRVIADGKNYLKAIVIQ